MSRSLPPQTPTRRSKRFQPLATPSKSRLNSSECAWSGPPLFTRPTNLELDVVHDEQEEDGETGETMETVFYGALKMPGYKTRRQRGGGFVKGETLETYRVGDTILVETDTLYRMRRPPSAAVIVSMWETRPDGADDEHDVHSMRVRVHWFLRPSELASIRAKRAHAENEIYYSLASSEILIPDVILSHCTISGQPSPQPGATHLWPRIPNPRAPMDSDEENSSTDDERPTQLEYFYCHLAINPMRGLFYEFNWDGHRRTALQDNTNEVDASTWGSGAPWIVNAVEVSKKRPNRGSPRKKAKLDHSDVESDDPNSGDEYDDSGQEEDEAEDLPIEPDSPTSDQSLLAVPQTPSKNRKRKRGEPVTPKRKVMATPRKSRTKALAQPTPHSKAALKRRAKAVPTTPKRNSGAVRPRTLTYAAQDLSYLPKDPWLRAMHVLHVGSRPDALPCREEEYDRVLRCIGELLEEGSGGCIYISGVPGTGKTATVHATIRELKRMAECNETNPFSYVEINGLRIPEPSAAYNLLWEGVSGHDVHRDGHLKISAKESLKALTRHFSGGGGRGRGPGGHACVVLMDELDQLVTAKQDVVYNFFNWPTLAGSKLVVIAVANTMDLPERVMTGRVRSRLGMIRINFQPYTTPQLEKIVQARLSNAQAGTEDESADAVIAPDAIKFAAMKVSSISGDARRVLDICRRTVESVQLKRRTARMADVREVIQVMQNSPTAAYLRECSFHERMMLASLIKCVKREGVEEIKLGEVQNQHLIYMNVLPGPSDPSRTPTPHELATVLESLVASRAMLLEDGAAAARKPDAERRVILNLEQGEVERVLSESGPRWKNILSG